MTDIAIRTEHLAKQYTIGSTKHAHDTLRDHLTDLVQSLLLRKHARRDTRREIWALKDVSVEVRRGEMVGIIGRNGAGKSTLLKILSRVTVPTRGRAQIYGRVGSLLEVGTGFHQELTGRENVFLSGAILGMRNREIKRKFDQIVGFAEVEQFIDTPVKHYSSGMYMRLAFAVAAHLDPDILLVDEVLSVGDLGFQRKCLAFAKNLLTNGATVLFVSHNMFTITAMCSRVIYIADGCVGFDGEPEEVIRLYQQDTCTQTPVQPSAAHNGSSAQHPVHITDVTILDESGHPRLAFDHGERMCIRLGFEAVSPVKTPNFVVAVLRSDNLACCNYASVPDGAHIPAITGRGTVELLTPPLTLVSELYSLHVLVWDAEFQRLYSSQPTGVSFQVRHPLFNAAHFGVFHDSAQWTWHLHNVDTPLPISPLESRNDNGLHLSTRG